MGASFHKTKTNDKILRLSLMKVLLKDSSTLGIIEELELARGKSRADVVCIKDNELHAYEIKSDIDSLVRLPRQIRYYNQVFSTVTLVVGAEHAVKALYLIPDWWGVIVADIDKNELRLANIRPFKQNTNTDYYSMSSLLRKNELQNVLTSQVVYGSYRSMSKPKLVSEIKKKISKETFYSQLSGALLNRTERVLSGI